MKILKIVIYATILGITISLFVLQNQSKKDEEIICKNEFSIEQEGLKQDEKGLVQSLQETLDDIEKQNEMYLISLEITLKEIIDYQVNGVSKYNDEQLREIVTFFMGVVEKITYHLEGAEKLIVEIKEEEIILTKCEKADLVLQNLRSVITYQKMIDLFYYDATENDFILIEKFFCNAIAM